MKKFKTIKKKTQVLESIICDNCNKEFDAEDDVELQEFLHIDFTGGYRSVFGDGTHIQCDICQHCLKDKLKDIYHVVSEMY
jgi:hypothetical protein